MNGLCILSAGIFLALQLAWEGAQPAVAEGAVASSRPILQQAAGTHPVAGAIPGPKPEKARAAATAEAEKELKRKIGQMILVGFLGNDTRHSGYQLVRRQLKNGEVTGVLFLGRNLKNHDTVLRMNTGLKNATAEHVRPLIAIDQEGGRVQRLRKRHGFPQTVSARRMARVASVKEAAIAYGELAKNLSRWGFNLNLGPVGDLDINRNNPIIGRLGRSYSREAGVVIRYSAAFIDEHRGQGVMTALKHFPGHGSSWRDSHKGMVDISRTWSPKELEPFRMLISEGRADLIMTAHVHNTALQDSNETFPVSLSANALSGVLRNRLGFQGVIISDDLQMNAIRRNHRFADAIIAAVNAGTDILLFANDKRPDPQVPAKVTAVLLKAAQNDPELKLKIDAAYRRILALKSRMIVTVPSPVAKPSPDHASNNLAGTDTKNGGSCRKDFRCRPEGFNKASSAARSR